MVTTRVIRVSKKNFEFVVRAKGYLEAKEGETYTFDEVLTKLFAQVPTYVMGIDTSSRKAEG